MINNRFLGSVALIVGTSMGGGILSLPIITAACGPVVAILLLTLCWWGMYHSAKNILMLCHKRGVGANFATIISEKLSPFAHFLFVLFYLLLMYSLISAYLVQGGELTRLMLGTPLVEKKSLFYKCIFIAVFGIFIFSVSFTDKINKIFLTIKLILFFIVCFSLAHYSQVNHFSSHFLSMYAVVYALPTVIVSFGFHIIIPAIYEYQNGDFIKTKKSIFYGSFFILIIYTVWILLCFLNINTNDFHNIFLSGSRTDYLVKILASLIGSEQIKDILFLFVSFSVVTSFLGLGLSLNHYINDLCSRYGVKINRLNLAIFVFLVPLLFNVIYPDGFITALQYASIFCVIIFMWAPLYVKGLIKKLDYAILMLGGIVVSFQICSLYVNFDPFLIAAQISP